LRLPLDSIHLSFGQRLRRLLWPFPHCTVITPVASPLPHIPHHRRFSGAVTQGDRVPRDSDGLPMWERVRRSFSHHIG
jgi:hypothetical protein